ncbi:MAG: hypothetical protein U0350_15260 [Caldilineaceae bacterium]
MVKKFMLVGLFVLTVGLLPLSTDLSGVSKVFANSGSITAFKSPLPPHGHPRCRIIRLPHGTIRICRGRGHR